MGMRVSLINNNIDTCFACGDTAYIKIASKNDYFCLCRRHFNTLKSKVFYLDQIEKGEIKIGEPKKANK